MPQTKSVSFLNHLEQVHYNTAKTDDQEIRELLKKFKQFNSSSFAPMTAYYIIEYATRDYILMSEAINKIAGYNYRDFIDSGLDMLFSVYHDKDFKVYNEKIFVANKQFLSTIPNERQGEYIFNYTFRVKTKENKLAHIYQRGSYITHPLTGAPLYSFGMVLNVSGMYNQQRMFHSIEKSSNMYGEAPKLVQQNFFYPNEEDTLLTSREKDVVRFMADGLSIKQIADKLSITENTVANHRTNMLQKTNAKNMAELVAFVIRSGII